jgi:hypothetical protein
MCVNQVNFKLNFSYNYDFVLTLKIELPKHY